MRINNNVTAINSHRQYGINNAAISKNVEKLSSGYRINRAGDDAAGLAISEKMRAQIRGLTMASKNSQDAISLIQTAEGALQSTHNVLQRMRELAVQSASDTNEQTIDRGALEQEFKAMISEINDTAAKTRFNDQNLIDGTFQKYQIAIGGSASGITIGSGETTRISATGSTYGTLTFAVTGTAYTPTSTSAGTAAAATFSTSGTAHTNVTGVTYDGLNTAAFNGNIYTLAVDDQGGDSVMFSIKDSLSNTIASATVDLAADWVMDDTNSVSFAGWGTLDFVTADATDSDDWKAELTGNYFSGGKFTFDGTGEDPVVTPASPASATLTLSGETTKVHLGDTSATFNNSGVTIYFDGGLRDGDLGTGASTLSTTLNGKTVKIDTINGKSLIVQSGANEGDEVAINIDKMNATSLGVGGSSIATRIMASNAITEVNDAINQVSTQRAALGALQNRMEFKIANLDTSAENLQAAESRIRDVDMAKEMTAFTKNNILFQASTAMLAQANALPQGVLQLLG